MFVNIYEIFHNLKTEKRRKKSCPPQALWKNVNSIKRQWKDFVILNVIAILVLVGTPKTILKMIQSESLPSQKS